MALSTWQREGTLAQAELTLIHVQVTGEAQPAVSLRGGRWSQTNSSPAPPLPLETPE